MLQIKLFLMFYLVFFYQIATAQNINYYNLAKDYLHTNVHKDSIAFNFELPNDWFFVDTPAIFYKSKDDKILAMATKVSSECSRNYFKDNEWRSNLETRSHYLCYYYIFDEKIKKFKFKYYVIENLFAVGTDSTILSISSFPIIYSREKLAEYLVDCKNMAKKANYLLISQCNKDTSINILREKLKFCNLFVDSSKNVIYFFLENFKNDLIIYLYDIEKKNINLLFKYNVKKKNINFNFLFYGSCRIISFVNIDKYNQITYVNNKNKKNLIKIFSDYTIQKYSEPKLPVGYAIILKKFPKNAPLPANFEPQFWRGQAERAGGSLQMVEVAGQICYFAGTWALEKDRDKAFETLKIEFPKAEKVKVEDWKPIFEK